MTTGWEPETRREDLWKAPGWLRRRSKDAADARRIADAREKAREGAVVPVVARHVPSYPAEPVVRPKRHRRGLRGRFR